MKKIKALVIQYKVIYLNIEANLRKFKRILKKYSYLKPDLVIFPEYALTGPLYSNYQLSFKKNNLIFRELSLLAEKFNVNLIPGSFIRTIGNKKYNSTCLINSRGQILGFYDKQCLFSSEKRHLEKGSKVKLFKTKIGRIAIQMCADLHSSRISDEYRDLKPDLIINLAMWAEEDVKVCCKAVPKNIELAQTEYLTRARAIENRSYAIFCNFADKLEIKAKTRRVYQETSIGNSMIVNPYGEVVAKVDNNKEKALFAEIDISKCHWSKYNY